MPAVDRAQVGEGLLAAQLPVQNAVGAQPQRCLAEVLRADAGEPLVAELGAYRGDELDREVVVTIGEQILGEVGEGPYRRRAAPTLGRTRPRPGQVSRAAYWSA